MSKLETNTIDTVSGTTNLVIGSTNSSTVTFENGSPTGHMYPAFHAYLSANQEPSNDTVTVVQFNTESFDTDSAYDASTNFRFTPQVAGKYFVYAGILHNPSSSNNIQQASIFDLTNNKFTVASAGTYLILPQIRFYDSDNRIERAQMYIRKNNSNHKSFTYYDNGYSSSNTREITVGSGFLETLAVSDYIELYAFQVSGGSINTASGSINTYLTGYKLGA